MATSKFAHPYKHNTIAASGAGSADSDKLQQKDWGIRETKSNAGTVGYRDQDGN